MPITNQLIRLVPEWVLINRHKAINKRKQENEFPLFGCPFAAFWLPLCLTLDSGLFIIGERLRFEGVVCGTLEKVSG